MVVGVDEILGGRHKFVVARERLGCSREEGRVGSRLGGRDLAIFEHLLLLHCAERGKAVASLAGVGGRRGARARATAARRARARGARVAAFGALLLAVRACGVAKVADVCPLREAAHLQVVDLLSALEARDGEGLQGVLIRPAWRSTTGSVDLAAFERGMKCPFSNVPLRNQCMPVVPSWGTAPGASCQERWSSWPVGSFMRVGSAMSFMPSGARSVTTMAL